MLCWEPAAPWGDCAEPLQPRPCPLAGVHGGDHGTWHQAPGRDGSARWHHAEAEDRPRSHWGHCASLLGPQLPVCEVRLLTWGQEAEAVSLLPWGLC